MTSRFGVTTPLAANVPGYTNTQPPGTQGIITLLGWIGWGVGAALLAAWLVGIGRLAWAARRGESAESTGHLGVVLICAILAGGAGTILNAI